MYSENEFNFFTDRFFHFSRESALKQYTGAKCIKQGGGKKEKKLIPSKEMISAGIFSFARGS